MSPAPSPPQALAELPTGAPPNVLVVGAAGVGKSALIGAMSSQAEQHGLVLAAAEGLPSGRALEAYAKVARTPSLAAPRPDVLRGGAVLTQLCPLSQVRLGVIVWEASLTQPLGAYVQQYVEQMQAVVGNPSLSVVVVCNKTDVVPCPIPQLAGAPAARRALHTPRFALHTPVCLALIRACCWCHRAWRCAAVHRSECGARHEPASPLWAVGAEPEQATLTDCEHGRPAREQHRVVVARRLRGPEEGLVWLGTAGIWTAKVVDYPLCRLWVSEFVCGVCVRVGVVVRRRPLRAGDCVWCVGPFVSSQYQSHGYLTHTLLRLSTTRTV